MLKKRGEVCDSCVTVQVLISFVTFPCAKLVSLFLSPSEFWSNSINGSLHPLGYEFKSLRDISVLVNLFYNNYGNLGDWDNSNTCCC